MKNLNRALLPLLFCLPFTLFSQAFVGDWTISIPSDDGKTTMTAHLAIQGDGTYTVDFGEDGQVELHGTYEVSGDQMIIRDKEGGEGCPPGAKGVYTYAITDEGMTMTRVSDECGTRGGPDGKMVFSRR